MKTEEERWYYLGDALYAQRDRCGNVILRTQRDVEHYVVMDRATLAAFLSWLATTEDTP